MDAASGDLYFSSMNIAETRRSRAARKSAYRAPIPAYFLYGEPPRPPDERLVHVDLIATRSRQYNWTIAPHRHNDLHQILLIDGGEVCVHLDGTPGLLKAPGLVVVPPGVVHSYKFQPGTSGLIISFAASVLASVTSSDAQIGLLLERATAVTLPVAAAQMTDIHALGGMLLREFSESTTARAPALQCLLGVLLAKLVRITLAAPRPVRSKPSSDCVLVSRFRRLVDSWFRADHAIGAYAARLGVSQSKLRRACLATTGQAPTQMIHLRVLLEAERQLRYTSLPIAQIGYDLGFADPGYFTRFFTQRARVPPREFRIRSALARDDGATV